VVGGWFLTAAAAFAGAATVAFVIHRFALAGLLAMALLVVFALVHSSRVHRRRCAVELPAPPLPEAVR
jgi:hypothetical protein